MTDAEIAGHMNWRGPGAYTQHAMKRIKKIIAEVQKSEREDCAKVLDEMANYMESEMEPSETVAWVRSKAASIRARGNNAP
jgi:hypothetical protein